MLNDLPCRQSSNPLKRRRLVSNGKKIDLVKRLKISDEKEIKSNFQHLPNEIYQEIFDYLQPINIIQSFYGLDHRLNRFIENLPMKLNFQNLTKTGYKRVLKQMVPRITDQIVSIDLNHSLIDLFNQSFHWTQFPHLRFLSLTSPNLEQLKSLFSVLNNLSSLRSLRLLEHSQNETVCKLVLANHDHYSIPKSNRLTHLFIETSPPFRNLNLVYKHLMNKISVDYLQINLRCALFFYPDSLRHLDYDGLSRLISKMNYLKVDLMCGTFTPAFDLIQRFPQIEYLSVQTRTPAYANGYQWADLFIKMPKLTKVNLKIHCDSVNSNEELETFKTKFWFERQWFVQCRNNYLNSSQCQFILRSIHVR
jgi:hypothetical protein